MQEQKFDRWIKQNIGGAAGEKIVFQTAAAQVQEGAKTGQTQQSQFKKPIPQPLRKGILRVIPLGGLDEVGKNMMVFEYERDIVIVDMGFQFTEEDMLGIDYVIPDVSYLMDKLDRIRGILITHGHLDHIGGIPYLLPKLGFPPIYSAKLTIGLVKNSLEAFELKYRAKIL